MTTNDRRLDRLEHLARSVAPPLAGVDARAQLLDRLLAIRERMIAAGNAWAAHDPAHLADVYRDRLADVDAQVADLDRQLADLDAGAWPPRIVTPVARRRYRTDLDTRRGILAWCAAQLTDGLVAAERDRLAAHPVATLRRLPQDDPAGWSTVDLIVLADTGGWNGA